MTTSEGLNRAMLLIQTLDGRASLRFSHYTGQWYIEARIGVSDGVCLTGVTQHRDDPSAAVYAFLQRLQDVPIDNVIVASPAGDRREFLWNGAAFAEQHGSICERAR